MAGDLTDRASAYAEALATLRLTANNIRSLGPAGALGQCPMPYRVWLDRVEAAAEGLAEHEVTDAVAPLRARAGRKAVA